MIKKILSSVLATMAVIAMATTTVLANEYKLFINNPVGSSNDQVARKLSQIVKDQSGINLVVMNVTGGNGLVAATDFKKERLAATFTNTSVQAYLPIQLQEVPYRLEDFNIISTMGVTGVVFFTRPKGQIQNLDDLVKILPKLDKGSVAVASADSSANAKAFLNAKNINVPVVNFKNHNDVVTQVIGGHAEVGVVPMTTDLVWSMADSGQVQILGAISGGPLVKDGKTYLSINQTFNIPAFYSGAWLAITPGNGKEQQDLKKALLDGLKDQDLQVMMKRTWPLGNTVTLEEIINTANKNKNLLK